MGNLDVGELFLFVGKIGRRSVFFVGDFFLWAIFFLWASVFVGELGRVAFGRGRVCTRTTLDVGEFGRGRSLTWVNLYEGEFLCGRV